VSISPAMLTDLAVVGFALWTVAANLVVIARGTTLGLVAAGVATAALMIAVVGAVCLRRPWRSAYLADLAADAPPVAHPLPGSSASRLLILPALTLLVWLATRSLWVTWILAVLSSVAAYVHAQREPPAAAGQPKNGPEVGRNELRVLHGLAVACALFTLFVVRPRSDDSFYLNMAVSVVDYPRQELLGLMMLHGPASDTLAAQPMFPPYKVHSFELLGGLISYVTGLPAAAVIHFVFATLLGWLVPFALARLLRMLIPRDWLFALIVVLSFYVIEGTAARGYANHAFVRLFNGKAALLTIGVPLICAYGLRFGAGPSRLRFALLGLSQVAAVGLSSTGLWLAPVLAMLSVFAATPLWRELPRRLLGSFASSAYVLAIGAWCMTQMRVGVAEPAELDIAPDSSAAVAEAVLADMPAGFARLAESFSVVLGPEHTAIHLLALAWLAALLAPTAVGRRLFSLLLLAVTLGFGNPLLANTIAGYITGSTTYHRVLWLLPIPIALAVCATRLFAWSKSRFSLASACALSAAALGVFYLVTTERLVIGEANSGKLQLLPALKLPPRAHKIAQEICKWAPTGKRVLASQAVLQQLPTLHRCGYPLLAADRWLLATEQDEAARIELIGFVDKAGEIPRERGAWFIDALQRFRIDAIVLSQEASRNARTKSLVRLAGFERIGEVEWEQMYVRVRAQTHAKSMRIALAACEVSGPSGHVLAPFDVSAAIAETRCAHAPAAPAGLRPAPLDDPELLDLERLTYMASDLPASRGGWLRDAVASHAIDTVVLSGQGTKNRRFKALLAGLGFRKAQVVRDHSVFRKLAEAR